VIGNRVRIWAWAGFAAQVVFVASWLIAAAWQGDHYSMLAHTISDLYAVTAPDGLFLVVVLTLCGLATMLFAVLSVWPVLRPGGATAIVGAILLALSIYENDANLDGPGQRVIDAHGDDCRQCAEAHEPRKQAEGTTGHPIPLHLFSLSNARKLCVSSAHSGHRFLSYLAGRMEAWMRVGGGPDPQAAVGVRCALPFGQRLRAHRERAGRLGPSSAA
jgi:hypothetical protein